MMCLDRFELFMNITFFLLMDNILFLLMNNLLFFLMDDWLDDFMHMFLVNDWLMEFMNHVLVSLVNDFLVCLFDDILMVLMYDILMLLFYNRSLLMYFGSGFQFMLDVFCRCEFFMYNCRFLVCNDSCFDVLSVNNRGFIDSLAGAFIIQLVALSTRKSPLKLRILIVRYWYVSLHFRY